MYSEACGQYELYEEFGCGGSQETGYSFLVSKIIYKNHKNGIIGLIINGIIGLIIKIGIGSSFF